MSHIIIDGYNLLAQSMYQSREDLLSALKKYRREQNHEITIFFDGTHRGTWTGDKYVEEHIQVIFSPMTVTADEMIEEFLEGKSTPNMIVVSSDRRIQKAASAKKLSFLESMEFLFKMKYSTAPSKKPALPWMEGRTTEESDYNRSGKKKGNAHKKSKKEKKKIRALNKI